MTAIALTIAGSDSGGGAGIQADLKTFSALGVYGASVLTAITAQNTQGVRAVESVSPEMVVKQIEAVLEDLDVAAIKIGMVANAEIASAIAATLSRFGRKAVLDPVMVATSGDHLLEPDAVEVIQKELLPLAIVVTPNLPEAAVLTDSDVAQNEEEMERQAQSILDAGAEAVLVKGGHGDGAEAVDLLLDSYRLRRFSAPRIDTTNDHGTGCTLSAAIAAGLARGDSLEQAVAAAKTYLNEALASKKLAIGHGRGPVHHFHRQW